MIKNYDPKSISVILGGHAAEGFAPDTFVTVERNNDTFTRQSGADGEQARSKTNDKSGRFTITLMQTSLTNAILQGYVDADEQSNAGLFPVLIKDNEGTELETAETAWVVKPSNRGRGAEVGTREWIIETGELVLKGGGTAGVSATPAP